MINKYFCRIYSSYNSTIQNTYHNFVKSTTYIVETAKRSHGVKPISIFSQCDKERWNQKLQIGILKQIKIYTNLRNQGADGVFGVEDANCGSLRNSLTTAASASGFNPWSQSAISTESVWRSKPVSRIFDIWKTNSRDSRAVRAASGSMNEVETSKNNCEVQNPHGKEKRNHNSWVLRVVCFSKNSS